jgi:hypothetical protein
MACLRFGRADSYLNIGCAEAWRRILTNHTTSVWIKTASQERACILSLSNGSYEVFSIDINISSNPIADTCGIAANRERYEGLTSVEKCSPGARSIGIAPSRSLKAAVTQLSDEDRRRVRGICSGGFALKVRDMAGSQISAYSYLPILGDDRWHLIQVSVSEADVLLWVDGRKISVHYEKREKLSGTFWSPDIVQRPIFPSQDLIGCRRGPGNVVADQFCGRISDISVERGGPGGDMLHWWVMDSSNNGSTVWDRGPEASRALNLYQCNCAWDKEDVPPTSLSVNGQERRFLTARGLTTEVLDRLLPRPLEAYGAGGIPRLSPAVSESSSCAMRRVVLDLWMMSYCKEPAVLAVIPFSSPIVVVLNADGVPSIALVDGTDAFVTQRDICDGKWHRVVFCADPATGASFSVDGSLSTWQHFSVSNPHDHKSSTTLKQGSVDNGSYFSIGGSVGALAASIDTLSPIFDFQTGDDFLGASRGSSSVSASVCVSCHSNPVKTERIRSLFQIIDTNIAALKDSMHKDVSVSQQRDSPARIEKERGASPFSEQDGSVLFPRSVVIGFDFCGFIRDASLTVGRCRVAWLLSQVFPDRSVDGILSEVLSTEKDQKLDVEPFGQSEELSDDIESSDELLVPDDVSLTISGRSVIWAKCLWDCATPLLDIDTYADLGEVLIPEAANTTGIEIAFYARLLKGDDGGKSYGHVFSVDRTIIVELAQDKVIITTVAGSRTGISTSVSQNSIIARRLQNLNGISDDAGKIVAFVCNTATFEDGEWHFLRLAISTLNVAEAVRLVIDDSAVEVTPLGLESASSACSGDGIKADAETVVDLSTAMSGQFEIPAAVPISPRSQARLASASGGDTMKYLRIKRQILLDSKFDTSVSPENYQTMRHLTVKAGGTTPFRGTICNVKIITDGKVYAWSVQDGTRHQLSRLPLLHDEAFVSHPKSIAASPFAVSRRPAIFSHYEGHFPTWSPMTLPPQSLRFDGESTFVSSISLGLEFKNENFSRFAVCLWMKEGTRPSGNPEMGCICSVHDSENPDLECSIAIYVHTKLNTRTSPKQRVFAPKITTFILRDSENRSLCLEVDCDIYDRLWHKVHWVVHEAESNESHVFIDDLPINSNIVCSESPMNFTSRGELVLNVGGRNNKAAGVGEFFCGEMRNFLLCRAENDDALCWSMSEGQGAIVYDTLNRVVGAVNCPTWEYTTFPPTAPAFGSKSAVEFSPVKDCEALFCSAGCRVSLSLKTRATRVGSIFSFVSATKKVLCGLNLNEGGDVPSGQHADDERGSGEEGTHTLFFHRLVQKTVVSEVLRHLSDSIESPRSPMGENSRHIKTTFLADQPQAATRPVVRKTNKEFLKELLNREARVDKIGPGCHYEPDVPKQTQYVIELVKLQFHQKELCDGRWHEIDVLLCDSDPMNCAIKIDGRTIPFLIHSKTNVLTVADPDVDAIKGIRLSEDPKIKHIRDTYGWFSFVLGQSQPSVNSFKGCIKNTGITTSNGVSHLFIPFASNIELSSQIPRHFATSNLSWELCVSPNSSFFLGDDRYIAIPPVPTLNMSAFRVSFQLRTPTNKSACLMEFGHALKAYFCIMLNLDTQGRALPNCFNFNLIDSRGNELQADCLPEVDICNNEWHEISITVSDSSKNLIFITVDGCLSQVRYGGCGCPRDFLPLEEGGTIGALLEVLHTRETLDGSIRYVRLESLDGHVHAAWDVVAGYGTAIMDSSIHGAHALAIHPMWRSDIVEPEKPLLIPRKAENVFRSPDVQLSVSRWSNNESDVVEKSHITGDTVMRVFPPSGWISGAKGPQWICIDLGAKHTIFSVEVELFRATPSRHELYFSRTKMTTSKTGSMAAFAGTSPIPCRTLVTTWEVRSTSSKVMETRFERPYYTVRYICVQGAQSAIPVAYQNIRINAIRGDWVATRKYSVMQALGKTPTEISTPVNMSMFPDTFTIPLIDEDVFNPYVGGGNRSPAERGIDDGTMRKTPAQQQRELKLLFFTQDVNRVGYIDIVDFIYLYREADTFGTASEDQIVMQLRDVGVTGNTIDFEQFIKIFSKFYSW